MNRCEFGACRQATIMEFESLGKVTFGDAAISIIETSIWREIDKREMTIGRIDVRELRSIVFEIGFRVSAEMDLFPDEMLSSKPLYESMTSIVGAFPLSEYGQRLHTRIMNMYHRPVPQSIIDHYTHGMKGEIDHDAIAAHIECTENIIDAYQDAANNIPPPMECSREKITEAISKVLLKYLA